MAKQYRIIQRYRGDVLIFFDIQKKTLFGWKYIDEFCLRNNYQEGQKSLGTAKPVHEIWEEARQEALNRIHNYIILEV